MDYYGESPILNNSRAISQVAQVQVNESRLLHHVQRNYGLDSGPSDIYYNE